MFVISRKEDEGIVIGHNGDGPITVMVMEIRGDKVRLGVNAPRECPVHRGEVVQAMMHEFRAGRYLPLD